MSDPTEGGSGPAESARRALAYVSAHQRIGLGTGRAAEAFVRALAERVAHGLDVTGTATSVRTEALARELGIPLQSLEEAGQLDVTFDGADEVAPNLDVIKGYGGAHVREKVVAASSTRLIILVGAEKLVSALGARGRLPVEVLPFAESLCRRRLARLESLPDAVPELRTHDDGAPVVTDNGNWILDCKVARIPDARVSEAEIVAIPGVVGTGLFVDCVDAVVIQHDDRVEVRERCA